MMAYLVSKVRPPPACTRGNAGVDCKNELAKAFVSSFIASSYLFYILFRTIGRPAGYPARWHRERQTGQPACPHHSRRNHHHRAEGARLLARGDGVRAIPDPGALRE